MTPARTVLVREPGRVPLWLLVTDRLPIGRGGPGLMLDDDRISRHHCELRLEGGDLVVEDLGSSNGTTVNGVPVAGATVLRPGDEVALGSTTVTVDPTSADPAPDRDLHRTVVDRPADPAAGPPARPTTVVGPAPSAASPSPRLVGQGLPGAATRPPDAGELADLRSSVVGGTITMLFSDIVDSTALNARLGDQTWYALLSRHNDLLRHQLDRYQGTEVKGQGDGFMLTFPSSRHALLFSISVQRDLERARAEDPAFCLHVRIGTHTGEVIHQDGDIFGRHVNYAARVTGKAGTDEVLASQLVRDLAGPMGDIGFDPPRTVELKGFDGPHAVYPVRWR